MVAIKQKFFYKDGDIDLSAWIAHCETYFPTDKLSVITKAAAEAQTLSQGLTTFYGQPSLLQGLEMAEILLPFKLDPDCIAAAIVMPCTHNASFHTLNIAERLSPQVAKLIASAQKLEGINDTKQIENFAHDHTQIDRLRKLLLAMVSDIRVVLLKLAERTCIMRGIKSINPSERQFIADQTMRIYAPLANRLGIGQLKWELEDTAFHYINSKKYGEIAALLAERRIERESRIQTIISTLEQVMQTHHVNGTVTGRAKHIYSIYNKMQTKKLNYADIYDSSAFRIIVDNIDECYQALSIVHALWPQIPKEFDDYIASPKPNGYRSIHTAVTGPDQKSFEIQIRTKAMHMEAEHGVAAHWVYKESDNTARNYENKINTLRQLVHWHQDTSSHKDLNELYEKILHDRVYIFTPSAEILDLPTGATPLDCAYHIHTDIGHRCRGAKINGHIVPLTYTLQTGDNIEIMTSNHGSPSRDWLNAQFGYLKTSGARAKVAYWFRHQELQSHVEAGKHLFEKEFSKHKTPINISKLANYFQFKNELNFYAAISRGNIRLGQIAQHLQEPILAKTIVKPLPSQLKDAHKTTRMNIAGVQDLLTRIALCCKPIPGDAITGFITQGRGISLHKRECCNLQNLSDSDLNRLIDVSWDKDHIDHYYVDIKIKANNSSQLLKEVMSTLVNEKLHANHFTSTLTRNNVLLISLTLQIESLSQLNTLMQKFTHLTGVIEVKRI
jgi:GTP pyrophosphokinase